MAKVFRVSKEDRPYLQTIIDYFKIQGLKVKLRVQYQERGGYKNLDLLVKGPVGKTCAAMSYLLFNQDNKEINGQPYEIDIIKHPSQYLNGTSNTRFNLRIGRTNINLCVNSRPNEGLETKV